MSNPLLDKAFIKKLYKHREKTKYVKITSYNHQGLPIETLEGVATGGSINLDGKSAARRSCSLTLAAEKDVDWALSTEFELEIGELNTIDNTYPEIIWFPMGRYLISSLSSTESVNNFNISIQGKDKVCRLNGEMGGTISSLAADFGKVEVIQADGSIIVEHLLLEDIIREIVHIYGMEPYHKIIIKDLPENGLELWEYKGKDPLYLIFKVNGTGEDKTYIYEKFSLNGADNIYYIESSQAASLAEISAFWDESETPTEFTLTNGDTQKYVAIKLENSEVAGYHPCPLIYAGELVANLGQPVTSVLDKITQMLGNFEYFYDVYGDFIFQKKPMLLALDDREGGIILAEMDNRELVYSFDHDEMVTQKSNNTNMQNIKNDFTVWGSRNDIPIHMRYAIDKKPVQYKKYKEDSSKPDEIVKAIETDWREVLYQMALDENKYGRKSDFRIQMLNNNDYLSTGYEQYYTDILGFWRQLYNPNPEPQYRRVSYNNNTVTNKYVDKYTPLTSITGLTDSDKLNLYTIYTGTDGNKSIQRWIDTINFSQIVKTPETASTPVVYYHIDDLYYNGNRVIDTLNFGTEDIYIKDENNNYTSIFDHIDSSELNNLYLASSAAAPKTKFFDYFLITEFARHQGMITNDLSRGIGLKTVESDEIIPVLELYLRIEDKTVPIWQYDNKTIDNDFIDVIVEAINNYAGVLYYIAEGMDLKRYDPNNDAFYIQAQRNIGNNLVYYKNASNQYILYADYKLNYQRTSPGILDEPYIFSRYNVYFKRGEEYVSAISQIDVDKASIQINISNNEVKEFVSVLNKIAPTTINNIYIRNINEKINLNNITDPIKNVYYENEAIKEKFTYNKLGLTATELEQKITVYIKYYDQYYLYETGGDNKGWNKAYLEDFNSALFWIDFIEPNSPYIGKYNVNNIGIRPYAKQINTARGLDFKKVKQIYFVDDSQKDIDYGEKVIKVQLSEAIKNLFVISSQGSSCKDYIIQWINQMANITNAVNLTAAPLYILEPNQEILINNDDLFGRYLINQITIPLAYNGTMSLQTIRQNTEMYIGGE